MPTETTKLVLLGMLRSKLAWLGTALIALPDLIPLISPNLEAMLDAAAYKHWLQFSGLLVIIFRFYTNKPLAAKGAESEVAKAAEPPAVIEVPLIAPPVAAALSRFTPEVIDALLRFERVQKERDAKAKAAAAPAQPMTLAEAAPSAPQPPPPPPTRNAKGDTPKPPPPPPPSAPQPEAVRRIT